MTYVALLRGINVGGNNMVAMPRLQTTFKLLGFKNVATYINSGNVIFNTDSNDPTALTTRIEAAILQDFGVGLKVVLRNLDDIRVVSEALLAEWVNDQTMKCDVMFLWPEADNPKILDVLPIDPLIEDVKYVSGAVLWRIDRDKVTKSRMIKIVGTTLYKNMTIRNVNTVRNIYALMQQAANQPAT